MVAAVEVVSIRVVRGSPEIEEIPCGLVTLWVRVAVSLSFLVGLDSCFTSQRHIIPSLEKETRLFAIWVPTTYSPQTGYLCASAEMPERWTGMDLTLISQRRS